MLPKFLTPRDLCERYSGSLSERTAANWRASGDGPEFLKVGGKILYPLDKVEEWERSRTVQSTTEYHNQWRD